MFQPEMATTCVSPAVANASLISGAIDARTPSRIPAPRAASGSGTIALSPSSSARSTPGQDRSRTRCRLDELDAPWAPDRSDALPGQVLAVREAVEVLGQLDARADPEAITAARVDATRHPDQQSIGQRHWPAVDGAHQVAEDELDPILPRPGIVHDPARRAHAPRRRRGGRPRAALLVATDRWPRGARRQERRRRRRRRAAAGRRQPPTADRSPCQRPAPRPMSRGAAPAKG